MPCVVLISIAGLLDCCVFRLVDCIFEDEWNNLEFGFDSSSTISVLCVLDDDDESSLGRDKNLDTLDVVGSGRLQVLPEVLSTDDVDGDGVIFADLVEFLDAIDVFALEGDFDNA